MGQGHHGGGDALAVAEDGLGVAVGGPGDAVGQHGGHRRRQARHAGGDEGGQDDLGDHRAPVDPLDPGGHPSTPAATTTAPMSPPKSAWDEEEGRPKSQVTRFHRMAPARPAKIIAGAAWTRVSSNMPWEIVLATSVDRQAPMTLRIAATRTARRGVKAPVATEVAMALAESWKPLVKSKTRAVTTTTITMKRMVLMPFPLGVWVTGPRGRQGGPGRVIATRRHCYQPGAAMANGLQDVTDRSPAGHLSVAPRSPGPRLAPRASPGGAQCTAPGSDRPVTGQQPSHA